MSKILKIRNVGDYSQWVGHTDTHPLVSVIDYAEVSPVRHCLNNYSVYGIFFHDEANIDLAYGCGKYDYKEGTVICVAPGQIGGKEDNGELVNLTGWALLFHPDLLQGTALEKHIREYSFFDYRVNEALHMTDEEHDILVSLMRQIKDELQKKHDALQDAILVGYIELMLNFCQRFYNRQFITRKLVNSDMLMKFDQLLRDYYEEKIQLTSGMPTVQYCADKLCMSANYFGDLIKKMTGDTASNYIRQDLIQRVKNELASGASISQVAYELGFEYPQHLSRMFKKFCGYTPTDYLRQIQKKPGCWTRQPPGYFSFRCQSPAISPLSTHPLRVPSLPRFSVSGDTPRDGNQATSRVSGGIPRGCILRCRAPSCLHECGCLRTREREGAAEATRQTWANG